MRAKLRCCMSCCWIFKFDGSDSGCPKCGWGHYSARYVYGDKAYRYAHTQEPWYNIKMDSFSYTLRKQIEDNKNKIVVKSEHSSLDFML